MDFVLRSIQSHPRAFVQMFNIWLRLATRSNPSSRVLAKALGFINWHFRPRRGGGVLCWRVVTAATITGGLGCLLL